MKNALPTVSRATFAWTAVLTILLAIFAFVLVLTNSKSETIRTNIQVLELEKDNYRKLDTCIAILYSAENNSRFFVVTQDSAYIKAYTKQLQTVIGILGQYQAEREIREKSLSRLIFNKQLKNQEFVNLRLMVDSLLSFSLTEVNDRSSVKPGTERSAGSGRKTEKVDTVAVVEKRVKRRLVRRVLDAIRDKEPENSVVKTHNNTVIWQDSLKLMPAPFSFENHDAIEKARRELGKAEQQLLSVNSLLFANLQNALREIKAQEEQEIKGLRKSLLASTKAKSEEMGLLMWASVVLVFLLAVIIIFNLARLYKKDLTILNFANLNAEASKRKGDFLAQVTHEFRTPLNAIIGFSNLIDSEKVDRDLKVNIESIKSASQMMLSLVNEILDFSKFESGKINLVDKPFQPAILVQQTISLLSVLANEKKIVISPNLDLDKDVSLLGDQFRIKQIVINLIMNAIKFTPEGGNIAIKVRFESQGKGKGTLVVAIKDNGVGIAREHLGSIFKDFIQVDNVGSHIRQSGTGLGLPICKRIVDLYGGQINVTSALGVGSEFTVRLPLKLAEIAGKGVVKTLAKSPSDFNFKEKRLLIADDTKINLILIGRIIDKLGASYDLAENGQKALEMFENNNYDMVITDIDMPVLDGEELTRRIRSHNIAEKSRVPVIGFTGFTDSQKLAQFREAGMNEILPKPFEENQFIAVLSSYLE
ncbi:ATP-binding response regulator [Dyadobacter aurulentus]|uniref:ATP-binding response regulator n=1 Tax=Dyadobacter sp. UC 10 TaxID=2605428 RepID=UPI0011F09DA2|nr:ATP-binding protein [Dyadobacter sp. UC 10]KAA0993478.1 response regulator [Dyadobacter sp. UC 10]